MKKIKEFLRDIFAPRIYVNKKSYGMKDFPEKEWQKVWEKQEEVFNSMNELFKKL